MSNSPPSDQEKASGDSPCDCLTKPATSESRCEHEISHQEEKQEQEDIDKGDAAAYDGGRSSPAPVGDKNGPQTGYYAESPACAQEKPNEAAVGGGGGGDGGGDDVVRGRGSEEDGDDGYHTPTSPGRRIPTDLPCPPAPRKSPTKRRWQKRKAGDRQFFHQPAVRPRLQLPDELELVFFPVADGPAQLRSGSRRQQKTILSDDTLVSHQL